MLDYTSLKLIWWLLVGVLLVGFAIMDGHDMGVGTLLPFVGKNDTERRVIINTVGPHWDGNQVWFITGGGAIFAAWPLVYATAFSGFYWAMLAVLWALFFRPVGFDYRSKIDNPTWRQTWDWGLFIGGAVPPLIFGVAFGNLFLGLPFEYDSEMRLFYRGGFLDLFSPFSLLCGILSIAMFCMHGAAFLLCKTEASFIDRARKALHLGALVTVLCFIIGGVLIAFSIKGYTINTIPDLNLALVPSDKQVHTAQGAWLKNYTQYPVLYVVPLAAILAAGLSSWAGAKAKAGLSFFASASSITFILLTAGIALFPFVMPSSIAPNSSLSAWDVVASKKSLNIMFWVVVFFLPIIILYTSWIYRVMRGKVDAQHIAEHQHSAY